MKKLVLVYGINFSFEKKLCAALKREVYRSSYVEFSTLNFPEVALSKVNDFLKSDGENYDSYFILFFGDNLHLLENGVSCDKLNGTLYLKKLFEAVRGYEDREQKEFVRDLFVGGILKALLKKPNMRAQKGNNFKQEALSFEEFIAKEKNSYAYKNFFYNFYNFSPGKARNYEMLKRIQPGLAEEMHNGYYSFQLNYNFRRDEERIPGYFYPTCFLQKGYEAYLILRENFKKDRRLFRLIELYNSKNEFRTPDDYIAFFE